MNIPLTPAMDALVQAKIASGQYSSPAEVVNEALHLLLERDTTWEQRRAAFDAELHRRIAALDRGEFVTEQQVRDRLDRRIEQLRQNQA